MIDDQFARSSEQLRLPAEWVARNCAPGVNPHRHPLTHLLKYEVHAVLAMKERAREREGLSCVFERMCGHLAGTDALGVIRLLLCKRRAGNRG